MRPQLLCTFTDNQSIFNCIKTIKKTYGDDDMFVDMYSIPNGLVCIYNVTDKTKRIPDTISINKKRETNTYYSINALNALIMVLNNGVLDKTFAINWHEYVDTMLLSSGQSGYKCLKLEKVNFI